MINFGDPIWEKLHSTRDWGKYPSEEVIKFYKKSITNHKADPKVLDAGAGKGSCSWFMVKEGGNVTAFDGSVSALNSISSLTNEFNLNKNIKTVKGNIINPKKFFKEKFDIIVDPVVVIPDILSKKESVIVNSRLEKIKGIEPNIAILNQESAVSKKAC